MMHRGSDSTCPYCGRALRGVGDAGAGRGDAGRLHIGDAGAVDDARLHPSDDAGDDGPHGDLPVSD